MSKVFRKIAFLTQFGLTMLIPTCLLFFLGTLLDKKLHTSFWCVIFFFIGALAGATGVWRLIKKEIQNDKADIRNRDLAKNNGGTPENKDDPNSKEFNSKEFYKEAESTDRTDEGEITPDIN